MIRHATTLALAQRMVKAAARLPRAPAAVARRAAKPAKVGCRWPYHPKPPSPLAQWPHVAGGDQPKACGTRPDGVTLVTRRKVPVVFLTHAGVGVA